MQATTCFHDSVTNPIFQEADCVFHDPVPFHTTNGMFNTDSDRRDATSSRLLWRGEFTPTRFFLGLAHRDTGQQESLEAHSLIETTARWPRITCQIRHALIMRSAFTGSTQEAHVTAFIDHEEVFERVAFLLATGVLLLVFRIGWTLDRSFGPLMPTRGEVEEPSVGCVASRAAKSSAVRAGSHAWAARV
jgi:hypothetical protein